MTLPSSGSISLYQVNVEMQRSGTATLSMSDGGLRDLAGDYSGEISMSQLHGKTWVVAGSSDYGTPGTYTWLSPRGWNSLLIQVWGAGGGGGTNYAGGAGGASGTNSSFNSTIIGGGGGGGYSGGGSGGTWSGGSSGQNGETAPGNYNGGSSPYGGAGGVYVHPNSNPGGYPGGGGSGAFVALGGGGGGFAQILASQYSGFAAWTYYTIVVGTGGAGGYNSTYGNKGGGNGATGRVYITWS